MSTTIKYSYSDSGTLRHGTYTGDRGAAIEAAVDGLDAVLLASGDYAYVAPETGLTYVCDEDEMATLGAGLIRQPLGDVYSVWCSQAGREADRREEREAEALRD